MDKEFEFIDNIEVSENDFNIIINIITVIGITELIIIIGKMMIKSTIY